MKRALVEHNKVFLDDRGRVQSRVADLDAQLREMVATVATLVHSMASIEQQSTFVKDTLSAILAVGGVSGVAQPEVGVLSRPSARGGAARAAQGPPKKKEANLSALFPGL